MSRRYVVTGVAGFIGSHLAEHLLADGATVIGIDALTPYYDPEAKRENLRSLDGDATFDLIEADVADLPLEHVLRGADAVFHLAAQPGVRASFGVGFADYVHHNLVASQRLFEAAATVGCRRVVWASSSSVYGDAERYPCDEATPTEPRSPYGATKRACEDLAAVYRNAGLETVGLRYFTVYGPRQRPDMAMRRLCDAAVAGHAFPLFGSGAQSRDFTYVDDAVDATVRAASAADPAAIYNVGGGEEATLAHVIDVIEELAGVEIAIDRSGPQVGDVVRTCADTTRARLDLRWSPRTLLRDGLAAELAWVVDRSLVAA